MTALAEAPAEIWTPEDQLLLAERLLPGPRPADFVQPAHLWVPDFVSTDGQGAIDFAEDLGLALDVEQRLALMAIYAEDEAGRFAALSVAIICARQNLKTYVLEIAALYDLFVRGVGLVIWTAHTFDATQETIRRMFRLVRDTPWLMRHVKRITEGNGEEGIELHSGSRIRFYARSTGKGRALTGDVVVLDEGLFVAPAMLGALMPSLSARPNPQVRWGSSAGLLRSAALRSLRARGRAGRDFALAYIEWCARGSFADPGCAQPHCEHYVSSVGCALDDRALWKLANPALNRRITTRYVNGERLELSATPLEFARERLGWWEDPPNGDEGAIIDAETWAALGDPESEIAPAQPISVAVDVSPDRSSVTIGIAGRREDGRTHVEIAKRWQGVWTNDGVITALKGIAQRWRPAAIGVDARGAAAALVPDLTEAVDAYGVKVHRVGTADMGAACGLFVDRATQDQLRHLGSPANPGALAVALAGARPKTIGTSDAWTWDRRGSGVDLSPLVAATVATWLLAASGDGPSVYETRGVLTL